MHSYDMRLKHKSCVPLDWSCLVVRADRVCDGGTYVYFFVLYPNETQCMHTLYKSPMPLVFSELTEGRRDMCAILAKNERGVYIVTYILLTLFLCVLANDKFSRL